LASARPPYAIDAVSFSATNALGPDARSTPRRVWWAAGALVLAALLAYGNSFHGPFVFDDVDSIPGNPTLRSLWPPWTALNPPHTGDSRGLTVSGRPILNFSLALNYAISGLRPWSYHVFNLLIHAAAGLTLFGVLRWTLARVRPAMEWLAFALALLWTLHPLQTESVTYVVQRAESLCGLFYLLTLYGFIRSAQPGAARTWPVLTVVACALGMATKEVMVSAPVIVLCFDRTFAAGSFGAAWRARGRLHAALATTWLLLLALVLSTGGNRGGSIGAGIDMSWSGYLLTQPIALVRYLALAVWPTPLVFEYGKFLLGRALEASPHTLLLAALALAIGRGAWRGSAFGFAGLWCGSLLAPTSLVPGTTQMIVEHRVYLALAPVLAVLGVALHTLAGRRTALAVVLLAAGMGALTFQRNEIYRTAVALWGDTVAKRPTNEIARVQFANALLAAGRPADALRQFEAVVQQRPASAAGLSGLGTALLTLQRPADAITPLEAALRLQPDIVAAQANLGLALHRLGRPRDALVPLETALRLSPHFIMSHDTLANVLLDLGRPADAIAHYEATLRAVPDHDAAHCNLGGALALLGRLDEAYRRFETALRLRPDQPDFHNLYADALLRGGRNDEALAHAREAVRLRADFVEALCNVGNALSQLGRPAEAQTHYEAAVRLRPDYAPAQQNLARVKAELAK
jgi:tetratricopeptide (TPR) repeat protein